MAEKGESMQEQPSTSLVSLQEQIDSQRDEIEVLKRTTVDLKYDLQIGINSVKTLYESQAKQIDTKFDMLSSMLTKMETSQASLTTLVQQQIGAEAERARLRKESLDATHQRAEEAAIEAERAKVELQRYHRKTIRNRWWMWLVFMVVSLVFGTLVKSATIDRTITTDLEIWLHAFNHQETVKVVDTPKPTTPADNGKHDKQGFAPFIPNEDKQNLARGNQKDVKRAE